MALTKKQKQTFNIILLCLFLSITYFSCNIVSDIDPQTGTPQTVDCPSDIAESAFTFAEKYVDSDTEYFWGGQDPLKAIQIDCSGLVIRCYQYALEDTDYSLPFSDTTAYDMYTTYSTETKFPSKGNLIFMRNDSTSEVSHIAIFEKIEDNYVYFVDSTLIDSTGDSIYEINGATERSYSTTNEKIQSYGIMHLVKNK